MMITATHLHNTPTHFKYYTAATAIVVVASVAIATLSGIQLPSMIIAYSLGASSLIALVITTCKQQTISKSTTREFSNQVDESDLDVFQDACDITQANIERRVHLLTKSLSEKYTSLLATIYNSYSNWYPDTVVDDMKQVAKKIQLIVELTMSQPISHDINKEQQPDDPTFELTKNLTPSGIRQQIDQAINEPKEALLKICRKAELITYITTDCYYEEIDTFINAAHSKSSLNSAELNLLREVKEYIAPSKANGVFLSTLKRWTINGAASTLAPIVRQLATRKIDEKLQEFPDEFKPHMEELINLLLKYLPNLATALALGTDPIRLKTQALQDEILPQFKEKILTLDTSITPEQANSELISLLDTLEEHYKN